MIRACGLLLIGVITAAAADTAATASALPDAAAATAAPVELDAVIVKGAHRRQESLAEQLRKAMQAQAPPPPADLNRANASMQQMAGVMSDPDAYRHSVGDHRFDTLPPPGDETNGCGADLTQGCESKQ